MCGQQQIVFGFQMVLLSAVMLLHHFFVLKLNDIISLTAGGSGSRLSLVVRWFCCQLSCCCIIFLCWD
jgi:hypothetical protein